MWNVFDHGRLTNQVLVQDARFQQLYEQYQDVVLRAARELDDAATSFAYTRAQVGILRDAVQAARRSLDIATVQYREGLVDFQRVLDSQRALFSAQERLVASQGGVVQYLITVYKAMGGGWQAGRSRPVLDDATQATMGERSDWKALLQAPLAAAFGRVPAVPHERLAMSQDPAVPPDEAAPNPGPASAPPQAAAVPAAAAAASPAGRGARAGALVIAVLIVASLVLYFVGDRLTPSTSQARIQAFVVPVAAEVAGKVLAVHIRNNDEVQPGQPLFDIDPQPYRIALERARADLESVRSSVKGSVAGVEAARASLAVSEASRDMAERDASRLEKLHDEDPGAISVRRLEIAQATRDEARSKVRRARADLRKAQEAAGEAGDDNAQLRSAVAAVEKAELDLARTRVVAPARGVVTDLRTDVGHFAQPGAPVMTLIAMHDLWISADLTENNIGHVDPGDPVAIVLDAMPGEVLKGRVRSIGGGVGSGQSTPPGTLPVVQNNRDWLRQAQRIPVAVEFDADVLPRLKAVRIGGQADVLVYTGDHPLMNPLGALYMRVDQLVHLPVLSGDMTRGDKAALRLTIGLGLAVFVAYGLALQAPLCRLHHGAAGAVQAGTAAADGQGGRDRGRVRRAGRRRRADGAAARALRRRRRAADRRCCCSAVLPRAAARQSVDHGAGAGLHADPGGRRAGTGADRRARPDACGRRARRRAGQCGVERLLP